MLQQERQFFGYSNVVAISIWQQLQMSTRHLLTCNSFHHLFPPHFQCRSLRLFPTSKNHRLLSPLLILSYISNINITLIRPILLSLVGML